MRMRFILGGSMKKYIWYELIILFYCSAGVLYFVLMDYYEEILKYDYSTAKINSKIIVSCVLYAGSIIKKMIKKKMRNQDY